MNAEQIRLGEDARREQDWKRWGPVSLGAAVGDGCARITRRTAMRGIIFAARTMRAAALTAGAEDGAAGDPADRQGRLCFGLAL